jgi:hypothetical protein
MARSHLENIFMGRQKHTAEKMVAKLRQVDVLVSQRRKDAKTQRRKDAKTQGRKDARTQGR